MAAGSEKFMWKLWPDAEHSCWQCHRENLRVVDVGEHRTHYPSNKTQFLCRVCQSENTNRRVEENRRALGLQA